MLLLREATSAAFPQLSIFPSKTVTFYIPFKNFNFLFPSNNNTEEVPVECCILGSVNTTGNAMLCGRGERRQLEPVWSVLGIVVFFVHSFV